jgi:hypothetical protein
MPSYVIRKIGSTYDAKAFPGFTTVSSSTALATIVEACDAALPDGGRIHLAGGMGTYYVGAAMDISNDFIELTGDGRSTYLSLSNAVNDSMIELEGERCTVTGLYIDGNAANNSATSHGIEAINDGDAGHMIYNNRITDFNDDGIHYGHASPWGSGNMGGRIYSNEIITGSGASSGIFMDWTATDCEVWGNLLVGAAGNTEACMTIDGSTIRMFGNHMWSDGYYAMILAPVNHVYNLNITGNGIMDVDRHGIYHNTGKQVRGIVISGNHLWSHGKTAADTYDSIHIGSSADSWFDATITGNHFNAFKQDTGVKYTRFAINDVDNMMDDCVVGMNTCYRYFEVDPLLVDTTDNVVAHNNYRDCAP